MKKYGLIGARLGHSFSVPLHRTLFDVKNMDAEYSLYEVDEETGIGRI